MEASIVLRGIGKRFGTNTVLADLSFGVEKGGTTVIIGLNGSGKSTILKILSGLVPKDAGNAHILGKEVNSEPNLYKQIGYLRQHNTLDSDMTILENLLWSADLYRMSRNSAERAIDTHMKFFGMLPILHRHPEDISFGEHRLVNFVQAILHDPNILLLDEPTNGLDLHMQNKVWAVLDRFKGSKTMIICTQNFNEAERFADRISFLHEGRIQLDGSLENLVKTEKGLLKHQILFKSEPPPDIIQRLEKEVKIKDIRLNGVDLTFYTRNRDQFFHALRIALEYQVYDFEAGFVGLWDIVKLRTDGGLK